MAEASCRRLLRDSYIFAACSTFWGCCLVLQCTVWRQWITSHTFLQCDDWDMALIGVSIAGVIVSLNSAFITHCNTSTLHISFNNTKKCVSHVYAMVLMSFLLISVSYSRHCHNLPSTQTRGDYASVFRNGSFTLLMSGGHGPHLWTPSSVLVQVLPTVLFWDCLLLFIFCWLLTTASVLIAQWELKLLTRRVLLERRNSVAPAG